MQTNFNIAQMNLPINSIDAYIQQVNQIPMLSPEDELRYSLTLQKDGDLDAAKQLIMAHLRYVVRVAKGYMGYGLPLADLIQEGNIGLMKAVKRFNPEVGVRLVTFAVHWIKAEIHEFIIRNWRIVKIATTKAQRKLFFNLRSLKKQLNWLNNQEVNDIANDLGVKAEEVREMEARLSYADLSLDTPAHDQDDHHPIPAAYLIDPGNTPEQELSEQNWMGEASDQLHTALQMLDARSQDIIGKRWLASQKSTLEELAEHYSISAERVRQLEKNALKKLKAAMEEALN